MSIWIELAGFLGGTLSEYAQKNRWSKCKTFIIMSCSFFALLAIYVCLTPSSKSIWFGIAISGAGGLGMGLFAVLLIWLAEWYKRRTPGGHE